MDNKSISRKFSELSSTHKVLLFLIIVCCACGVYWYTILDDKLTEIAQLTQTSEKLDQDIERYKTLVAKLPALEQSLSAQRKELYYTITLLPEDARALVADRKSVV